MNMTDQSSSEIRQTNVGPNDVLLGRGGATNNHSGNHNFRILVAANQEEYLQARKHEKVIIARRIVAEIQNNGGRFLQSGMSKDHWEEVSDKRAQEKTSQALREGLDVRNQKLRPNKLIKAVRPNSESSTSKVVSRQVNDTSATKNIANTNGTVATPKMSALKSLLDNSCNLDVPTIKDESSEPQLFLTYQPRPVRKQELQYACEV
jgi:hypothetical protein